jgi:hypothetical protein
MNNDQLQADNKRLRGLILKVLDLWWPFVHGRHASNAAVNLRKELSDGIQSVSAPIAGVALYDQVEDFEAAMLEKGYPPEWFNGFYAEGKFTFYEKAANCMFDAWRAALANQPAPARLTKDEIRAVFLANGFTVKEGRTDLKPYVYAAAEALLSRSNQPAPTATPEQVAQGADEHALFEAWYIASQAENAGRTLREDEVEIFLQRRDDSAGTYIVCNPQWTGWQARAALSQPSEAAPLTLTDNMALAAEKEVMRATGKEIGYRTIKAVWEGALSCAAPSLPVAAPAAGDEVRMAIANLPLPEGSKDRQHGFVDAKQAVLDLLRAHQPAQEQPTLEELLALLPGTHYMDQPDGGSPTVLEQLKRMAEDAANYRGLCK